MTVDFIAKGERPDEYRMVLVEQGPWSEPHLGHLRQLQNRLYGCVDAALSGQLASRFPESGGKRIVIQVDCYEVPEDEVRDFFERFTGGVFATGDYRDAMHNSAYVRDIVFRISFDQVQ